MSERGLKSLGIFLEELPGLIENKGVVVEGRGQYANFRTLWIDTPVVNPDYAFMVCVSPGEKGPETLWIPQHQLDDFNRRFRPEIEGGVG